MELKIKKKIKKLFYSLTLVHRIFRPIVKKHRDRYRVSRMSNEINKRFPNLNLDPNGNIIDLGANRGDFSVWASSQVKEVYSFEPHPLAFKYLCARVKRLRNVHCINCAISNNYGLVPLFLHNEENKDPLAFSISASLSREKTNVSKSNFVKCISLPINEILNMFETIELLKIDIEGAETLLWPEIKVNFKKIKYLLIELHDSVNPSLRLEVESFINKNDLSESWKSDWL